MNSPLYRYENLWALAIFAASAYITLFNLGAATLWRDEATMAITANNLLTTGGYNGWDGRNLHTGINGVALNSDLKIAAYPPWQALPSALGMMVFGVNEFGARFFHSILGLASVLLFWLLLRLDFAHRPRLRILAFALFALSTQTLLFFRYGRYVADAIFFAFLMFYFYRLYIGGGGKLRHLAVASLAVVLGFFNHFAIGGSFTLALAAWHLIYHREKTSRRQWVEITAAGLISCGLMLFYLLAAGIIGGDDKLEHVDTDYTVPWLERKAYLIYFNFRELVHFGWVPLWVSIWFIYFVALFINKTLIKQPKKGKRKNIVNFDDETHLIRWCVLLALFLFFSGLLVLRKFAGHSSADMRYIALALAFSALIVAAFIDWLWQRKHGLFYALPVLATALLSNALAYPYIYPQLFTGETVRVLLPNLLREIHSPFDNYMTDTAGYLNKHAHQDDTIYVPKWEERPILQFYLSERLIFCCNLDSQTHLPQEKIRALGAPLYKGDVEPIWIVEFDGAAPDKAKYELVYTSTYHGYSAHRPELEAHTFEPLREEEGVLIYRRRQ